MESAQRSGCICTLRAKTLFAPYHGWTKHPFDDIVRWFDAFHTRKRPECLPVAVQRHNLVPVLGYALTQCCLYSLLNWQYLMVQADPACYRIAKPCQAMNSASICSSTPER